MSDATAVVVLYRWHLRPGAEAGFADAWTSVTAELLARGSLGSRLHRGDDGLWYGYAQWPSLAAREAARAAGPVPAGFAAMAAAVEDSLPEVVLAPVADLLHPLASLADRRPG